MSSIKQSELPEKPSTEYSSFEITGVDLLTGESVRMKFPDVETKSHSLLDIKVGDNLRGATVIFNNTDKPVPTITSSVSLYTLRPGSNTGISISQNLNTKVIRVFDGFSVAENITDANGEWLKTSYVFPDDIDLIVTSNNIYPADGDDWGFNNTEANLIDPLIWEINDIKEGYVKKQSEGTQLLETDLTLRTNRKLLLERLDGSHEAAIFTGMYGTRVTATDTATMNDGRLLFIRRDLHVDLNAIMGNSFVITDPSGTKITISATTEGIVYHNSATESGGNLYFPDGTWVEDSIEVEPGSTISDVMVGNTPTTWSFYYAIFNIYEQEEAFSMADPTCINHGAKASNGQDVGIYPLVNVRPFAGGQVEYHMAFNEDVQVNRSLINQNTDAINNLDTTVFQVANGLEDVKVAMVDLTSSQTITGIKTFNATTTTRLLRPGTASTYDIGQTTNKYRSVYAVNGYFDNIDEEMYLFGERLTTLENKVNKPSYDADLSETGSQLRFTIANVNILVSRKSETEVGITLTSSTEQTVAVTCIPFGSTSVDTGYRQKFTVGPTGANLPYVGVGVDLLVQYYIRISNTRYVVVVGSDTDNLSETWAEVEETFTITQV